MGGQDANTVRAKRAKSVASKTTPKTKKRGGLYQREGFYTTKEGIVIAYTFWQATEDIPASELPSGVKRRRITGNGPTQALALSALRRNREVFQAQKSAIPTTVRKSRDPNRQTLTQWSEEWVKRMRASGSPSDIVVSKYEAMMKNHILPDLGHLYLDQITDDHISLVFNNVLVSKRKPKKDGATSSTPLLGSSARRNIYKTLDACLNQAVLRNFIKSSPMPLVRKPILVRPKSPVDTPSEDMKNLMEKLAQEKHPDFCRYLFQFLGVRKSERLGLMWKNVKGLDTNKPRLTISHQLARFDNGDGWYVKPSTKIDVERTIIIPEPWLSALRERKKIQDKQKKSKEWKDPVNPKIKKPLREADLADLIFLQPNGGLITPNKDNEEWKALLKTHNIPYFRGHLNRHITATWLASMNPAIPMPQVMAILGHHSEAITYYYAKAQLDNLEQPMDNYGKVIFPNVIAAQKKNAKRPTTAG